MSTGICKSPDSRYWRELYKAALAEIGKSELPERIAEAEKAIVLRARELFQAAGDNGEETEALEEVMYALHTLGSNCQLGAYRTYKLGITLKQSSLTSSRLAAAGR